MATSPATVKIDPNDPEWQTVSNPTAQTTQINPNDPEWQTVGTPAQPDYPYVRPDVVDFFHKHLSPQIAQGTLETLNDLFSSPDALLHPLNALRNDAHARVAISQRIKQDAKTSKLTAATDALDAFVPFIGPQAYNLGQESVKTPGAAIIHGVGDALPLLAGHGGEAPEGFQAASKMQDAEAAVKSNSVNRAFQNANADLKTPIPTSPGIENGGLHAVSEMLAKRATNLQGKQIGSDVLINEGLQHAAGELADKLSKTADPASWAGAIQDVRDTLGGNIRHIEDTIRSKNLNVSQDALRAVQARAKELANQLEKPGSDYNLPNLPGGERARAIQILQNFAEPNKLVSNIDQLGTPIRQFSNPVSVPKTMRVSDMLDKLDQLQEITGPYTDSVSDGALQQLKGSLSNAIRQSVGPQISNEWDTANRNYATMMNLLRKTTAKKFAESATPSQLADTLLGKNASAIENIQALKAAMGMKKFGEVQRALWQRIVAKNTDADGILNTLGVVKDWDKLGQTKQIEIWGNQQPAMNRFVHAARLSGVGPVSPLTGAAGAFPAAGEMLNTVGTAPSVSRIGRGLMLNMGSHVAAHISPEMISRLMHTKEGLAAFSQWMRSPEGTAAKRGAAKQLLYLSQIADKNNNE